MASGETYKYRERLYPVHVGPKRGKYIVASVKGERKKIYLGRTRGAEAKEEKKPEEGTLGWAEIEAKLEKTGDEFTAGTLPYAWLVARARKPTAADLKENLRRFRKMTGKKGLKLQDVEREARDFRYVDQGMNMRVYDLGNNILLKVPYGQLASKEMNRMVRDYKAEPWFFAKSVLADIPELGGYVLLQEKLNLEPPVSKKERLASIRKGIEAHPELYKQMTWDEVADLAAYQTGRNQQGQPRIYDYL